MYPYTIRFVRLFRAGTLAGLTHTDSIGFFTLQDAFAWIDGIAINAASGDLDYTLADWSISPTPGYNLRPRS